MQATAAAVHRRGTAGTAASASSRTLAAVTLAPSPYTPAPVPAAGRLAGLVCSALLPARCAGCGRWETTLCPQCRSLLDGPPAPVGHLGGAQGLEVHALSPYAGAVRALVLAWKHGTREDLRAVMAQVGRRAGQDWATGAGGEVLRRLPGCRGLLVVPAPSGRARRLRGRLVAADLADAVATGAATGLVGSTGDTDSVSGADDVAPACLVGKGAAPVRRGVPNLVASADVLRRRGGTGHQTGLSARGRRLNRAVAPVVLSPVSGWAVLLVDDVVTTGTTLGGCARALRDAGACVLGALVVAAAPAPISPWADVPPDTPTAAPTMV